MQDDLKPGLQSKSWGKMSNLSKTSDSDFPNLRPWL